MISKLLLKKLTSKHNILYLFSATSVIADRFYSMYIIKQKASLVLEKWEMRMHKATAAQLQKVLNTKKG